MKKLIIENLEVFCLENVQNRALMRVGLEINYSNSQINHSSILQ